MARKHLFATALLLLLVLPGCNYYKTESYDAEVANVGILNKDTFILRVGYRLNSVVPGNSGKLESEIDYDYCIAEYKTGSGTMGKRICDWYPLRGIICHDDIIGLSLDNGVKFLRAGTLETIYSNSSVYQGIYDFTPDIKRVLLNKGGFYEYSFDTGLYSQIVSDNVYWAAYNPLDTTRIAYIGSTFTANNVEGNLYLIDNDGTNVSEILSGYNIKIIYWKNDGDTILFFNGSGIWSIKKNGANLTKLLDVSLPQYTIGDYELYDGVFAYVEDKKLKFVNF